MKWNVRGFAILIGIGINEYIIWVLGFEIKQLFYLFCVEDPNFIDQKFSFLALNTFCTLILQCAMKTEKRVINLRLFREFPNKSFDSAKTTKLEREFTSTYLLLSLSILFKISASITQKGSGTKSGVEAHLLACPFAC